jgi:hypothetical protein
MWLQTVKFRSLLSGRPTKHPIPGPMYLSTPLHKHWCVWINTLSTKQWWIVYILWKLGTIEGHWMWCADGSENSMDNDTLFCWQWAADEAEHHLFGEGGYLMMADSRSSWTSIVRYCPKSCVHVVSTATTSVSKNSSMNLPVRWNGALDIQLEIA